MSGLTQGESERKSPPTLSSKLTSQTQSSIYKTTVPRKPKLLKIPGATESSKGNEDVGEVSQQDHGEAALVDNLKQETEVTEEAEDTNYYSEYWNGISAQEYYGKAR